MRNPAANAAGEALPEAARRVAGLLADLGHDQPIVMLPASGKTWAEPAAGHPHAVFNPTPQQLLAMTGAEVADVAQEAA